MPVSSPAQAALPVRIFKISDAALLQFARLYRNLFQANMALFTSLNPELDAGFSADWLAAITDAENMPTDEVTVDQQVTQTTEVLAQMAACRHKYKQVIYFAGEAFGGSKTILNEFGQNDYLAIRTRQNDMATFMGTLHAIAVKYSVQLAAKGFTSAQQEEINTLRISLTNANVQQQQMINERRTTTTTRVQSMNLVYHFCQRINRASKQVFAGKYVEIQKYLLPASENAVTEIALLGSITAQQTGAPIATATVSLPTLGLSTTANEFGAYAFTQAIPRGTHPYTATAPGSQPFSGTVRIRRGHSTTVNIVLLPA